VALTFDPQPNNGKCTNTTNTENCMVCLFTSQLSPAPNYTAWQQLVSHSNMNGSPMLYQYATSSISEIYRYIHTYETKTKLTKCILSKKYQRKQSTIFYKYQKQGNKVTSDK